MQLKYLVVISTKQDCLINASANIVIMIKMAD